MSDYGAQKFIHHYGIMGQVKAALEATVRYLAVELGPAGIRVHAVSPGPIKTRAASGIGDFEQLLGEAASRAPQHQLVTIADVGAVTAMLCSDMARALTGNVTCVDAGYRVIPAKAGIQTRLSIQPAMLDSRLRENDEREVILCLIPSDPHHPKDKGTPWIRSTPSPPHWPISLKITLSTRFASATAPACSAR